MNSTNDRPIGESTTGASANDGALESPKPWVSLKEFKVTCQDRDKVTAPIYANGRQQLPIKILIEALDENNVVVRIPEDSLIIWVVDYNTGGLLPTGMAWTRYHEPKYLYDGTVQRDDNGALAASGDEDSSGEMTEQSPNSGLQVFNRWITVDRVMSVKIAIKVTSPAGIDFVTNSRDPAPGKFDSFIIIDAKEPNPHPWGSFAMSGPHNVAGSGNFDVDLYYIYFTDPDFQIVDSINHRNVNANGAHYAWVKADGRMEHIAYQRGDRRQVTHHSCFHGEFNITFTVDDRPGQATAARVRDGIGGVCPNYSYQHGLMGYIDQYGNESKVLLKAASHGNTMSLDNPNKADDIES